MGVLRRWVRQLGSLGRDRLRQSDLDREFAFHVEMEAEARMAAGEPAEEARRRALLSFGGVDRYQEEMRDGWPRRAVTEVVEDVRFALRGLRRTPVFTVAAVSTLALGLGGAAAVFTAVNEVLLAPLPYEEEERVVRIFQRNSATNRWSLSVADVQGIASWQRSFASVAAVRSGEMALSGGGAPVWVRAGRATEGLFDTFRVDVARGRTYQPADATPDAPAVVVISDELARRHFGGTESVGRAIVLDRESYVVIGVLPPGTNSLGGVRADVWPLMRLETPARRGPFGLAMFARLGPGVAHEAAVADLARVSEQLFPIFASSFGDRSAILTPYPLREVMLGDASSSLGVLFGAVALVLLIALANVANLVLVRTSGRRREVALRAALGAGRPRLTRLLLTENIVLSMLGGVLAVLIAYAVLPALHAFGPALPGLESVALGAKTIVFTMLLSLCCGIAIALYPLAFGGGRGLAQALRGGDLRMSSDRGTRVFQDGLVVAEFALALPLLAGAALLLHSFLGLQRVDVGVDASNVIAIRVSLPATEYGDAEERQRFWTDVLREVSAVPGVVSAGVTSSLPPDNGGDTNNFDLVDRPVPAGTAEPVSPWSSITSGYFSSLRVPLLSGRTFHDRDDADSPPVLLVSRAWAERYFPGESPLGRQLVEGGCTACPRSTIVGIVGDIKYGGLTGGGEGVYVPYAQWSRPSSYLVVRTNGDPGRVLAPIRARIHAVDPDLPLVDTQLMRDRLGEAFTGPRLWTLLVGGFAAIAVLLAGLGVFGVMSCSVSQRQREIGIRLALGASPLSVIASILRRGLVLAGIGTVLGLLAALQATRLLEHVLYDVRATDPRTLAGVAVILLLSAAVACYLPGRRAAAVDPVRVMAAD